MNEPCVIKILGADAAGFPGVDYNEKKVAEGVAALLKMKNFGPLEHYQFHATDTVKKYLQKIADRNDRVQHPQLHIMVSYPGKPTEEEKQKLLKDFEECLDRLGYKGQPFLIYAHYDTGNWHLHAVSVRVQQGTGRWINNSFEGVKARQHLDDIRGVDHDKALDKMLNYNFTSKEQFQHILRANGYHFQEDGDSLNVYRACQLVFGLSVSEIEETAEANKLKNKKNRKEQLDRVRQVRAIISKYRDKSLNAIVDVPELKKTKRGKIHTVAPAKAEVKRAKFQGSDGLELSDLKKAQFKKFLTDLKRTAGVELIFHRDKDGKVRGYSVIDNAKGNIFNGSDIMKMSALLNGKNMMEEIIPEELAAEVSQEYRNERNADRDKIDPSNVFEKMMERLEEMGLKYDYPPLMRPYVSELSALQNCQKAIELITLAESQKENGNENWVMNAQKAVEHAEGAAQMDRHDKEKADEVQKQSKSEVVTQIIEKAKTLPVEELEKYITGVLDDNKLPYKFHEYSLEGLTEERTRAAAISNLEKALTDEDSSERISCAGRAANLARTTEQLHKIAGKQKAKQTEQPKEKYDPNIGVQERQKAITTAKSTLKEYLDSHKGLFSAEQEGKIFPGIAARCIEDAKPVFNEVNLIGTAQELAVEVGERIEHTTLRLTQLVGETLMHMALPEDRSLGGPDSNNDLSRKKDDEWDRFKNTYMAMRAKGRGQKRQ
jgi:hypothetical protein